jgi:hypothetical protein
MRQVEFATQQAELGCTLVIYQRKISVVFLVFVLPFCLRFSRSLIICLFVFAFADPMHFRPRVCRLPENSRAPYNPRSRDDIYRLRNFSITSKGVVNRGDAIISRHSRSNTSINSTLTA